MLYQFGWKDDDEAYQIHLTERQLKYRVDVNASDENFAVIVSVDSDLDDSSREMLDHDSRIRVILK